MRANLTRSIRSESRLPGAPPASTSCAIMTRACNRSGIYRASLRPHAVECPFHSACQRRIPLDRTLLPSRRKSNHRAQRISRRPDHLHHDGVYRRGEPANSGARRACRSKASFSPPACRRGRATLVMGLYANYPIALAPGMSLNAYFTYVVCLGMHVPWRTALGRYLFFRRLLSGSYRDPRPGTNRQRHSRLSEVFDCRRHRDVHRVRRAAQRQSGGRESGNVRQPGKFCQSRNATGLRRVWRSCWF